MGPIGRRIAGFTAGAVLGTALFAAPLPAEERPSTSSSTTRSELLRRWERSRRVDLAFREVTTRTTPGETTVGPATAGRTTREDAWVAQRLPERVVSSAGGVSLSAIIDGRAVGCVSEPGTTARCHDAGPADASDSLELELRRLRDATRGAGADYRLSALGDGCFRLRLVRDTVRPTFGRRHDVCFDERSGLAHREVSVVGDVTATTVRSGARPARDEDFVLPAVVR